MSRLGGARSAVALRAEDDAHGGPGIDAPGAHPTALVHPSAVVDPSARIGPYCVVGERVRIGPGTALQAHVVVHRDTSLGEQNTVFPFAVLGADPQDLKFKGERTNLRIGDRNTIREHVTIHRGTGVGGGETVVGSDCLLMVGAHVAHDCALEDQVILANGVMLGGHCLIEFGAILAGAVAVHHFVTVGPLAFVGGMARITKDVPPYLVVEGNPAEPRKVNTTALYRRGWEDAEVDALKEAYKALFFRSRNADEPAESMRQAMERLRSGAGATKATLRLCEFLDRMSEGVHGRWRETLRDRSAAAKSR